MPERIHHSQFKNPIMTPLIPHSIVAMHVVVAINDGNH